MTTHTQQQPKPDTIMARYIYFRVSTENQSYDRQMFRMREYFDRMGMTMDGIDIISEKITSHTKFTQRKIYPVLNRAKEGDIIYVCQLDRLGRTVSDILSLIDFADEKGVTIITINDGSTISKKTPAGRMVLTVLAAVAQMERDLREERCQAGVDSSISEIRNNGYRITRRGAIQTHWGNEKGCDTSAAVEASATSRQLAKIKWKEASVAYQWTMDQVRANKPRRQIIDEFNKLHALMPKIYCTRQGKPLTPPVLSRWISEAGLTLNV